MVTEEGLEDQMLSLVVKSEEPKKYEQSKNCITIEAENNQKIAQLQQKILDCISNAEGDLLENDELINTLKDSKTSQVSLQ